jgi:hypothetical protein
MTVSTYIEAPLAVHATQWTGDFEEFQADIPTAFLAEGNRVGANVGSPTQSRVYLNLGDWAVGFPDGHVEVYSNARFMKSFIASEDDTPLSVTSLEPNSVEIGGAAVTMVVNGAGFTNASAIIFNGGEENTTFITSAKISTIVNPEFASMAISVPVKVRDKLQESEELPFEFTEPVEEETRRGKRNA